MSLFRDPHALWRFDRETQTDLLAYWQIARASDLPGGKGSDKVTPASARMMLGRPASVGDLAHMWLMTHPAPKTKSARTLRDVMPEDAAPDAVSWWLD